MQPVNLGIGEAAGLGLALELQDEALVTAVAARPELLELRHRGDVVFWVQQVIGFETIESICEFLECEPGDLLDYTPLVEGQTNGHWQLARWPFRNLINQIGGRPLAYTAKCPHGDSNSGFKLERLAS